MWKNLKLILHSLREYKIYAILTPLFMMIEAACDCALPFVMTMLGDEINKGEAAELRQIGIFAGIFLGIAVISLLCGIFGAKTAAKATAKAAKATAKAAEKTGRKWVLCDSGRFVKISAASLKESHPHDIHITKEAPNYSIDA